MAAASTVVPRADGQREPSRRADLVSWGLLAVYVAVLLVVSWKRWGNPLADVGLDLTVASGWLDGVVPYRDVRYWYGPLGIGVLAGAFAVFGAHLWVAMAVGLAQTALIAELTRRLARRWLPVPATVGVMAVVLAIGFSGTGSNFQLPHTFAATTGLVALLFALLALSHERFALAGLAVGATALTRPEFLAFGVAAVGGAAFGAWRAHGLVPALRGGVVAAGTALLVAVPVLGWFAAEAGLYRVLFENIVPLEFLRTVGAEFERGQHPFDLPSLGTLLVRGAVLVVGTWAIVVAWTAVVAAAAGRRPSLPKGSLRLLIAATGAVVLGLGVAAVGGQAGDPLSLTRDDITRFLIAMTALPAVGLGALGVAALIWLRGGPSPLDEPSAASNAATEAPDRVPGAEAGTSADAGPSSGSPGWVAGGALIAAAAAASLRSYAFFSTDVYAPYYAPPVVLVAAIVLHRILTRAASTTPDAAVEVADAHAQARAKAMATGTVAVVGAVFALSLSMHAYVGLYRDFTVAVETPNGSFKADVETGAQMQPVFDLLRGKIKPGDRILAMPQEPGFYFLTGAQPALYDATFLPGVLATPSDDFRAAAALTTGTGLPRQLRPPPGQPYVPPRFVIEANWNFALWGYLQQGVDVNVALHGAVVDRYRVIGRFGDTESLPPKLAFGRAFTVYERR